MSYAKITGRPILKIYIRRMTCFLRKELLFGGRDDCTHRPR